MYIYNAINFTIIVKINIYKIEIQNLLKHAHCKIKLTKLNS